MDSIELLDVDGDRIHDSVINKSTLSYVINTTPTNATYTCRVNSTLGSQNVSLYVFIDDQEIEETTVQSIATTLVFTEQNSILTPNIPLIPTAASIAIILTLLLIILILACIILLR